MSATYRPANNSSPDIELCTVGFDSAHLVQNWVANAKTMQAKLALADNHVEGASIEALRTQVSGPGTSAVRYLHLPSNPGFAVACNALAESSNSDWLAFVNPDALVIDWNPSSLVNGQTVYGATQRTPSGRWIHSAGIKYTVADEMARSWLRRKPASPCGAGFVSGGAMLIKREVFLELGGFDEQFFMFYEDIDLCLRANQVGVRVEQIGSWRVEHDLGHISRKDWLWMLKTSYTSGRTFHSKWEGSPKNFDAYIALDALARSTLYSLRKETRPKAKAYKSLHREAKRNFKDNQQA